MDFALTPTSVFDPQVLSTAVVDEIETVPVLMSLDEDELFFQLGLWLSGLESFLNIQNHWFIEEHRAKASSRDWTREFRLTHSTLLLCSRLTYQLNEILRHQTASETEEINLDLNGDLHIATDDRELAREGIYRLSAALKDVILVNEALLRAAPLKFAEWTAWSHTLSEKLESVEMAAKLIGRAEIAGERFLPDVLTALLESRPLPFGTETDLRLILPRFARILKWLSVVETMLETDEPLKPTLLIFSRIYEQIQETTAFINNRLLRFPNEDDELFAQLDGAAYTASIELRKVYNFELAGLADMRSTPMIFAKIETAFALLNDSLQLTLVNFAQLIDPQIEKHQVFPNLKTKFEQSMLLRQNLRFLLKSVRDAEKDPDRYPMNALHEQLNGFLKTSVNLLFYKDRETVERFIEEVLVTRNKKDLVPILHRFGAYLETLFGQVNMRVALAGHPFDYEHERA